VSRSKTSISRSSVVALLLLLALAFAFGCKKSPGAIAELTKADGPVERQQGQGEWGGAPIGTKYQLGDAARTADGGAELELAGGSALIKMDKYTTLRFGGSRGAASKIAVELGAINLVGAGNYGLDVGNVKVGDNGSIRITAKGQGKSSIELLVGNAQISGVDGQLVELQIGQALELGLGPIEVRPSADAGVPEDAATTADAAVEQVAQDGTVEVTGKKVEILLPGETKWQPLPAGITQLTKGSKIRAGVGSTAKLIANGVTLAMAGSSRAAVGDDLSFAVELGVGTAAVEADKEGKVGVPGGTVVVKGPGKARLDVGPRGDAKIAVLEGTAKLTGASGADLAMKTGESASLAKAGAIQQTAKIPDYYDLRVNVGDDKSFTVHDPKGTTALQFNFNGKCTGGTIELDDSPKFNSARISSGKESANIIADTGSWYYRLVCSSGATGGSGHITVRRDAGTRPLPKDPPLNFVDTDGRAYRISYQSLIPNIKVKFPAGGSSYTLHLATGGSEEKFESKTNSITLEGKKLKEATYTFWVDKDGNKIDKISTLQINFDQTAPQVYIESPSNAKPFGAEIDVRGAVLPGWTAKVDVVEIPVDKGTRRFAAKVPPPSGAQALAIRLSHPQRGVHFYLRRGAKN
jgi:hypothetical protein